MKTYKESFKILVEILKYSELEYEGKVINKLARLADNNINEINNLYKNSGVNSIFSIFKNITTNNNINENKLKNIWANYQNNLRKNYHINIDYSKEKHISTLDSLGILDHFGQGVTFFIHPQFSLLFFKYLFDKNSKIDIKKHETTIKNISQKDSEHDEDIYQLQEKIIFGYRELLKHINKSKLNEKLDEDIFMSSEIEFLPTSTDFYKAGINFYNSNNSVSLDLYKYKLDKNIDSKFGPLLNISGKEKYFETPYSVFATSSGLLLPEEFYGSDYFKQKEFEGQYLSLSEKYDKNEYRENYFERLNKASKNKPIFYYYDKTKAKEQFNYIYNKLYTKKDKQKYQKDAIKIWNKFSTNKHIEIIKVDQIKGVYEYLTLSNGRNIIITNRGKEDNKIGHGFWLKPNIDDLFENLEKYLKNYGPKFGVLAPSYFMDFNNIIDFPLVGTILGVTPVMLMLGLVSKKQFDENKKIINTFFRQAKSDLTNPKEIKKYNKGKAEIQINQITDLFE